MLRRHHYALPTIVLLALLVLLSFTARPAAAQTRVVSLYNHLNVSIYLSITPGSTKVNCTGDVQCPEGSACDTAANAGFGMCFWIVPKPASGSFEIAAGDNTTMTFPYYANQSSGFTWSGNIGACVSDSGICASSASDCATLGCGLTSGYSAGMAEFTFLAAGSDTYDISVLNGFNIGVSMSPVDYAVDPSNPYNCGTPGSPAPASGLGAARWSEFKPPSDYYLAVPAGGVSCTDSSQCSGNDVCGLSWNGNFQLQCGTFAGFWTVDQICQTTPSFAHFNCSTIMPSPPNLAGITVTNLAACTGGVDSCYQLNSDSSCCGCVDWSTVGILMPSTTQNCTSSNPTWRSTIQPTVQWIKEGCPTCYTYPYDDPSSTFVCPYPGYTSTNNVDYRIDFFALKYTIGTKPGPGGGSTTTAPTSIPTPTNTPVPTSAPSPTSTPSPTSSSPSPTSTSPSPTSSSPPPASSSPTPTSTPTPTGSSSQLVVFQQLIVASIAAVSAIVCLLL